MDITDNGAGGNVLQGASSDVGGLLKTIENALSRISSTLKAIDTSFSNIQKGLQGGGASAVSSGGTGAAPAAMTTPGAGGADGGPGGLAMGMATAAIGGGIMDKVMSGAASMYKDIIPTTATALTFKQLNYQYGIYNGSGRPLIEPGGDSGTLVDLIKKNPTGMSSETGYAALVTGLARLGSMSNDDVNSRDNPASGFADLYKVAGVTNEQAVDLAAQSKSPESEIMMMALGYDSPVNPDGSNKTPFSIVDDVLMDVTQGKGGFKNKDVMLQQINRGGLFHTGFEATGQPMEYVDYVPFMQEAMEEYKKSGSPEGAWATLDSSQRERITGELTDVNNPDVNPQARESMSIAAKALSDVGLTDEVVSGWNTANKYLVDYLGYLSNLPLLEELAYGSGANSVVQNTEGGWMGMILTNLVGSVFNLGKGVLEGLTGTGGTGGPTGAWTGNPTGTSADVGAWELGVGGSVGKALGDWNVSADQDTRIHRGEMVLPSRIATLVRHDLERGGRPPEGTPSEVSSGAGEASQSDFGGSGGVSAPQVTINVSVAQASEEEAVRLAQRVKSILSQEDYLTAVARGGGY